MIPNKTEEQILNKYFKFFDLEDSNLTNLQNFIKTNEKLGVSLSQMSDLAKIFNYFDKQKKGVINYKEFSNNIFKLKNKLQDPNNILLNRKNFISILNERLCKKGGNFPLTYFIKALQIIDYNNSMKMSIDDFIKVLNESHLDLNSNEIQYLFQEYEFFMNGVVNYKKILEGLYEKFYNKNREIFAENFYNNLTNDNQITISLNDIRNLYRNSSYNNSRKELFDRFLDEYKFITKASIDKPMTLNDIKKFIKIYGYGIESDNELKALLFGLDFQRNFEDYENGIDNQLKNNEKYFHRTNKYYINNKDNNQNKKKIENIIDKIKKYFIKYGRKSFFNFIKHFQYFDNNVNSILKFDFVKVLKDFNINIPLIDVEKLYEEFATDEKKLSINYIDFLNEITSNSLNDNREKIIEKAINLILDISDEYQKPVNLNFIKDLYCPKNNYFIRDEILNKNDFDECLELFHYAFKRYNNEKFNSNEFFEFYQFISFLIENDNDFISLLINEWKLNDNINNFPNNNDNIQKQNEIFSKTEKNYDFNKNNYISSENNKLNRKFKNFKNEYTQNYETRKKEIKNNYYNYNKNNTLEKLKQKLKGRGIRGLLYLHKQFILSCPNLNQISFKDFKNILQEQHIILEDFEYNEIYNKYYKNNSFIFPLFIREFKKELNEEKLYYVENAYSILDKFQNEKVPIDYIKKNYDAKNHPEVISGKKNEEEKLLEFIDCFEINFDLLNLDNNNNNIVNFEIFANFYEYVAFVYENNDQFGIILKSTFH